MSPRFLPAVAAVALAAAARAAEPPAPAPEPLRVEAVATFESAGLRVAAAGRAVADFSAAARFREKGGAWRAAMDLVAVPAAGEWRGSLLGLRPDTEYEAECALRPVAAPPDAPPAEGAAVAFRTWAEEVPVARTVRLPAGVSAAPLRIAERGTPEGWVLYAGDPAAPATLEVPDPAPEAVLIEGAEYAILENVTVRGGLKNGIRVAGSRHVRIRRCDISGWGQPGTAKPGLEKGLYVDERGRPINYQAGVAVGAGCSQVVVEGNFIHAPRGTANSWAYGHPMGPQGVLLNRTDGNHVVRDNDIVGDERHWWNDAIESIANSEVTGGPHRDTDLSGNLLAFANDDGAELDGGQINVRFWNNRVQWALCGVSCAPNRSGPSYVFRNLFVLGGEERGRVNFVFKMGGDQFPHPGLSLLLHNTVASDAAGLSTGHYGPGATPIRSRNNAFAARSIRFTGDATAYDFAGDVLPPGLVAAGYAAAAARATAGVPRFADPDRGDYRLAPGSPGLDAAAPLPGVNDGFAGRGPDAGAFESGQASEEFPVRPGGLSALPAFQRLEGPARATGEVVLAAPPALGTGWRAHANAGWLAVEPAAGPAGPAAQRVALVADAAGLRVGRHRAAATFRTDRGFVRTVLVELRVRHPAPFARRIEAEDAEAAGTFARAADPGAGGGVYLAEPYDPARRICYLTPAESRGALAFRFDAPARGTYFFLGRVCVPDPDAGLRDSFYATLDDAPAARWNLSRTGAGRWTWRAVDLPGAAPDGGVELAAGPHVLRILVREAGTQLDAVHVSNEPFGAGAD